MSRHSKKNKEFDANNRLRNDGEAASDSRFSHFVDEDEGYRPFAGISGLKPQPVSTRDGRASKPSGSVHGSSASSPASGSVLKSVSKSSNSALVKNTGIGKDAPLPASVLPKGGTDKKVVGGYDPSADFGDILRQWEATGDPYAMPGRHAGEGPGVGRRLKKNKEADSMRKLEDTTLAARKAVQSMDFAQIFAQWEADRSGGGAKKAGMVGKSAASDKKGSPDLTGGVSKSQVIATGPRKDFAEILAEWEASQVGKNIVSSNMLKKPVIAAGTQADGNTKTAPGDSVASIVVSDDMEQESSEEDSSIDNGRPKPVWSAGKPTRSGSDRISGGGGFADIYDEWAAQQRQEEDARLEQAVAEKEPEAKVFPQVELSKLRQMLPQVTLDLHGLTAEESGRRVRDFLQDSYRNGIRKVCVIHGKGIHAPQGQGVLKDVVLQEIDRSKVVREFSTPSARYGGSGVLWLILKA